VGAKLAVGMRNQSLGGRFSMIRSNDEADDDGGRLSVGFNVGDEERWHGESRPRLGVV